ncbi:hypothetical protein CNX65_31350 [Actinosynnema pretiosum]|uniref:Uncharacterized protein n=1 Tax=Actinosynnema pretiosum TaxID=42197 RepID=A0A290ZE12_9PSEU|nr:hypothetical protein CNX65_31350 [Actinosynnema pretiosum]
MNAESIRDWLRAVGVPDEVVSIGEEADNTWCLVHDDDRTEFEVFWREQGNRYDWVAFTAEDVACHYLFGRLAWAQVARGAVGVLDRARTEPAPAPTIAPSASAAPPAPAPPPPPARPVITPVVRPSAVAPTSFKPAPAPPATQG